MQTNFKKFILFFNTFNHTLIFFVFSCLTIDEIILLLYYRFDVDTHVTIFINSLNSMTVNFPNI